ncbi:hypothetical protein ACFWC9_27720 [Streptomyces goshikiensis]|uniref:hypothetical protein n=1 Tax=Streptomyces goshikiensis TaxID=1942 RepID=UPI003686EB43
MRSKVAENAGLLALLGDMQAVAALPFRQRLATPARASLRRLDEERDLSRIVVHDLAALPALLEEVREGEMRRIHAALAQWLRMRAGPAERDRDALAVVLVGAVSHFWLLRDVFDTHPSGLDEDRLVAAFVDLAEGLLRQPAQGLLAAVFMGSGFLKSTQTKEKMIAAGQTGVAPFPLPVIRVVAALAERFFSRQNGPSTLCVAAIC